MDFLEINKKAKENELMKINVGYLTVEEATDSIRDGLNIDPLIETAESHNITCEDDAKNALSMSMQARKLKKTLEETRLNIVRPHIDFQRAINQIVKEYTSKLESIETRLKGKLEAWLELQSTFNQNFSEMVMEVDDGKLSQVTSWTFELEDLSKVPQEFLTLDEKKVKEKIKKGIREIPGLKIFEKTNVTMRIKND